MLNQIRNTDLGFELACFHWPDFSSSAAAYHPWAIACTSLDGGWVYRVRWNRSPI